MKRPHQILGGLLLAQIALAGLTWTMASSAPAAAGKEKVFDFSPDDVTEISIESAPTKSAPEASHVDLVKKDDKWLLASAGDYPVDESKAKEVVDKLTDLAVGEPIATNAASHNALRVGDRDYDRKVTVKTASGEESVILGSGPRSTLHVRRAGADDVRESHGTPVWNFHSEARSYVDTAYVKMDKSVLREITVTNAHGRLSFAKNGDEWELVELPAGTALNDSAVNSFVSAVSHLNLQDPVGKDVKPAYGLDHGATVVLAGEDDKNAPVSATYTIGAPAGKNAYYAKAADNDYVVTVAKYAADQILNKTAEDFAKKPAAG
jgi:hypothetical protein